MLSERAIRLHPFPGLSGLCGMYLERTPRGAAQAETVATLRCGGGPARCSVSFTISGLQAPAQKMIPLLGRVPVRFVRDSETPSPRDCFRTRGNVAGTARGDGALCVRVLNVHGRYAWTHGWRSQGVWDQLGVRGERLRLPV